MMKVNTVSLASMALVGMFLAGCGGGEKPAPSTTQGEPSQTARVVRESRDLEVAGTVRAADAAEIAGRYGGFVNQVAVHAGSRVRKGDLLVLMDDQNLLAQQEKLKAAKQEIEDGIKESRYQSDAAESQKRLASNTFERIRAMYEKKAASKQEYEEAESRSQAAEAAWQSTSRHVAQMESRSRQIDSDLQDWAASYQYVRITAPFDGIVSSTPAEQGTFANPGQTLVSVERTASYQVLFSVEEPLLARVERGHKVRVAVPAVSDDFIDASIAEVSPSLEAASRTYQVKADLPGSISWRSGLSATVLLSEPAGSALWVPAKFVNRNQDLETVMVRQGNEWRRVLVKSGDQKADRIEILSGVNEGDEVGLFEEVR
jgi:RND family efflux transporter MFP subunit